MDDDSIAFLLCLLIGWMVMGWIGYRVGMTKGRANEGMALAMLLGPIGMIIVLLMPAQAQPPPGSKKKRPVIIPAEDPMEKWEREQRTKNAPGLPVRSPLLAGANDSPESRLRRAEMLLRQGLITQEEYQAKRAEILEGI